MSQSGKLMPNLDQNSTKILNLTVLQRIDPYIEEILITAAHVTFYEFNVDLNQWVWIQVIAAISWTDFPCSWTGILTALSTDGMGPKNLTQQLTLAASVYVIWCERNHRLFTDERNPVPNIVQRILASVYDRVAWKQKKTVNVQNGMDA